MEQHGMSVPEQSPPVLFSVSISPILPPSPCLIPLAEALTLCHALRHLVLPGDTGISVENINQAALTFALFGFGSFGTPAPAFLSPFFLLAFLASPLSLLSLFTGAGSGNSQL